MKSGQNLNPGQTHFKDKEKDFKWLLEIEKEIELLSALHKQYIFSAIGKKTAENLKILKAELKSGIKDWEETWNERYSLRKNFGNRGAIKRNNDKSGKGTRITNSVITPAKLKDLGIT